MRNSDGTELPEIVGELGAKVYSTYFVGRGDQEWALAHPEQRTRVYLMSERIPATRNGELAINLMTGWFAEQVTPDLTCDVTRWWQVIDRSTGQTVPTADWRVEGEGVDTSVLIANAQRGHVYTVNFLATQVWDPHPDVQLHHQQLGGRPDPHQALPTTCATLRPGSTPRGPLRPGWMPTPRSMWSGSPRSSTTSPWFSEPTARSASSTGSATPRPSRCRRWKPSRRSTATG